MMMRLSVIFLSLGLFSLVLGIVSEFGISFELGRFFLFIFLGLAMFTFTLALSFGRRPVSRTD